MNELEVLAATFDRTDNEIHVEPEVGERAMVPLRRMLDFGRRLHGGGAAAGQA